MASYVKAIMNNKIEYAWKALNKQTRNANKGLEKDSMQLTM